MGTTLQVTAAKVHAALALLVSYAVLPQGTNALTSVPSNKQWRAAYFVANMLQQGTHAQHNAIAQQVLVASGIPANPNANPNHPNLAPCYGASMAYYGSNALGNKVGNKANSMFGTATAPITNITVRCTNATTPKHQHGPACTFGAWLPQRGNGGMWASAVLAKGGGSAPKGKRNKPKAPKPSAPTASAPSAPSVPPTPSVA